jgi:ABC-type branched-subunit amino acid transport system substrate-binding protein
MKRTQWLALAATLAIFATASPTVAFAQSSDGAKPLASEIGVTPTTIRLAVIADVDTPLAPGLFQGSVNGVKGWAKYVNAHGGLAGRKVTIDFIDSKLSADEARNAAITACQNDFALVGTSALFLSNVDDIEKCTDITGAATGIPDLAVVANETDQQCSPTTYSINPPTLECATRDQHPQTYHANAGRAFYYQQRSQEKLHGAYLFTSDIKSAENANRGSMTQMQRATPGIKQDFESLVSGRATQSVYTPIVQQLKDKSSNYAQSGSSFNSTVLLRKEAKLQGITDPNFVWDCTLQCYDKNLIEQGGADVEGQYISTLFLPFEEKASNKMLAQFLKYVPQPDGFAIQAWASGLLIQQAITQAVQKDGVNAVTRKALFDELATIKTFNAAGMIGATDIADHQPTNCFALVQVKNSKFVRVFPTKKGTFDCKARNLISVKLDLLK